MLAQRQGYRPDATALQTALTVYRSSGLTIYAPTCGLLLAEIHHLAGDDAAARTAVEAARELTRRTGEVPHGSRLEAAAERWG